MKTRFLIELIVEGNPEVCEGAVKSSLDNGDLQDGINAYESDERAVKAVSAVLLTSRAAEAEQLANYEAAKDRFRVEFFKNCPDYRALAEMLGQDWAEHR